MPSKPKPAALSRADLLAEAAAAWAKVEPAPKLDYSALLPGVHYTAKTYAKARNISESAARTKLKVLVSADKPAFVCKPYKFADSRQAQLVYWPAGLPGPDGD